MNSEETNFLLAVYADATDEELQRIETLVLDACTARGKATTREELLEPITVTLPRAYDEHEEVVLFKRIICLKLGLPDVLFEKLWRFSFKPGTMPQICLRALNTKTLKDVPDWLKDRCTLIVKGIAIFHAVHTVQSIEDKIIEGFKSALLLAAEWKCKTVDYDCANNAGDESSNEEDKVVQHLNVTEANLDFEAWSNAALTSVCVLLDLPSEAYVRHPHSVVVNMFAYAKSRNNAGRPI